MKPVLARAAACATLSMLLGPVTARAVPTPATLDWDVYTWTNPFSTSETYNVGGGVTVSISDPNDSLTNSGSPPSPQTNSYLDPVSNAGEDSLFLRTQGNTSPWVGVSFDFLHPTGVRNVTFAIFDVDRRPPGQFIDVVLLRAREFGSGLWFTPTAVTGISGTQTWVWNGALRIEGVAASAESGGNSDNGVAVVSFTGVVIDRIELEYRNTNPVRGNQWIAVSDVYFVALPEPGAAPLAGAAALALAWRRRRRAR